MMAPIRGGGQPGLVHGRVLLAPCFDSTLCTATALMNLPVDQTRCNSLDDLDHACLQDCIARYASAIPSLADLGMQRQALTQSAETNTLDALIGLYEQCYPLLEKAMWSGEADFHALLASYQALFREQESLILQRAKNNPSGDTRHHFILNIPIADRPPHLRACLESIYQLCAL